MALDKRDFSQRERFSSEKAKMKRDKAFQTKVIVRRLPPSMTEEQFLEQISPLPEHDYLYFVKADLRLGQNAFSRAYINFLVSEDIFIFKDKFDGYVFLDNKGNEYPAIVEYAPFQKIPKKRNKKRDAKCGTITNDPDYLKFLESLANPDEVTLPSAEVYLEEIESREKELKANNGVLKMTTPLIEYLKVRKLEQQKIREEKREERKRKEMEKKRIREEERRRRKAEKDKERVKEKFKDKDSLSEKEVVDEVDEIPLQESSKQPEPIVQVLKNPEREKDQKEQHPLPSKTKDYFVPSKFIKDKERPKKEWERIRPKERPKLTEKTTYTSRDKDRSRRDKTDYKVVIGKKTDAEISVTVEDDESKNTESVKGEHVVSLKDTREDNAAKSKTSHSQWSPKDKRDNSCPGNVETGGSQKEESKMPCRSFTNSSKSVTGDETVETNENSKSDSSSIECQNKDPRLERRIRNKDRPSLEIYRPGMRRFSAQRSSPQKEISTSASNSSSPSPTPPLALVKSQANKDIESTATKTVNSATT